MRAKPMTMFVAKCSMISKKSPPSTISLMTWRTSYGVRALSGMIASSSGISCHVDRLGDVLAGRIIDVVAGDEAQEALGHVEGLLVGVDDEVDVAGDAACVSAPPRLSPSITLAGDLLDDFGPGDEHLLAAHHDDEVGQAGE